ncbi:MAG: TetR/AcrR family transcriptional regulator [Fusobacteriota bacterium]
MKGKLQDELISNAEILFAKNGYIGTTVKDITDKTDVSKGSFYNCFKNKEDILLKIFEKNMIKYDSGREIILEKTMEIPEKIKALIRYELKFYMENKSHYALILRVMSGEKLKIKKVVMYNINRRILETKIIKDLLEKALEKSKIKKIYKNRLVDIANIYNATIKDHIFYLIGKSIQGLEERTLNESRDYDEDFFGNFLKALNNLEIDIDKEAEFIFNIFYNGISNSDKV